ncbi:hypothetical protein CIK99_00850 [Prevotella sp. P5-92]|uniref:hypothetical protein n=1 Tax=Prevotella sp. P5-92 TaxID=2024222 RepID=UPI000B96D4CB|nr:hypothetical protein [Prevotella sp. P5-92]OYP59687.1 hypothetical protein CIK99_00850 [Prevotella sp. P5-92]
MKRINNYVLNGALALLSTAGFVACSSSDDVTDAPVNPTYDGKSVKTQFAINIATPSNGKTRMSDVNTQNNGNYLGMTNVRLLTLADSPADNIELTSVIPLADPNTDITTRSSHIYSDVNIPVGTSDFLFYSTRSILGTDMDNKFKTGAIVSDMFTKNSPSYLSTKDIKFNSETILSASNTVDTYKAAFENFLNSVIAVSGWSTTNNNTLKSAYNNIISSYSNGQYAGSANEIKKLMTDLYNAVNPISSSSTASDEDKNLASAIMAAINNSSNEVYFVEDDANPGTLKYGSTVAQFYYDFPCYNGLPEGSALLTFDNSSNKFIYDATPQIGGTNKVNSYKLTYPLPIVYFDNTPAKCIDKELETSEWKTTTSDWDYSTNWTTGWYNSVKATSRSIALQNNINYGVACLETKFSCEGTTLEDNRKNVVTGSQNQTITIPSEGFQVTGILIGGQPENVNWQFINAGTNRDYVVYDKELSDIKAGRNGASSAANYTLVFDNWTSASTQEPVNVAIELVNTAADFYGVDGIVAKGQKFYLIGRLDPTSAATDIKWPTYNDTQGENTLPTSYQGRYPVKFNTKRVFVQDYTTKANFTINSLKNAYVTIPDLRATKLQLGLSVDLKWQSGLTFDVPIE